MDEQTSSKTLKTLKRPSTSSNKNNKKKKSEVPEDTALVTSLEKIIQQNNKISKKVDQLLSLHEDLNDKVSKLEENRDGTNMDDTFFNSVISNVAKDLLYNKSLIYPDQDDFREAMESYLQENHEDYFSSFSNSKAWRIEYEKKFYKQLLKKNRSYRGTLASRIRNAVFSVFGEEVLPPIKSNAPPADIADWKRKKCVNDCYEKLFSPMALEVDKTYMLRIVEKVWANEKRSDTLMAYTVGISESLLNPEIPTILITENMMKPKIEFYQKNLKSILNRKSFHPKSYSEEEGEMSRKGSRYDRKGEDKDKSEEGEEGEEGEEEEGEEGEEGEDDKGEGDEGGENEAEQTEDYSGDSEDSNEKEKKVLEDLRKKYKSK